MASSARWNHYRNGFGTVLFGPETGTCNTEFQALQDSSTGTGTLCSPPPKRRFRAVQRRSVVGCSYGWCGDAALSVLRSAALRPAGEGLRYRSGPAGSRGTTRAAAPGLRYRSALTDGPCDLRYRSDRAGISRGLQPVASVTGAGTGTAVQQGCDGGPLRLWVQQGMSVQGADPSAPRRPIATASSNAAEPPQR